MLSKKVKARIRRNGFRRWSRVNKTTPPPKRFIREYFALIISEWRARGCPQVYLHSRVTITRGNSAAGLDTLETVMIGEGDVPNYRLGWTSTG